MSKPYKVCPDCGSHLDAGEICDCAKEADAEKGQQVTGNPHGPVLVPGA